MKAPSLKLKRPLTMQVMCGIAAVISLAAGSFALAQDRAEQGTPRFRSLRSDTSTEQQVITQH